MSLTHRDLHAILGSYELPATYQATIGTDIGPDPEGAYTVNATCGLCNKPLGTEPTVGGRWAHERCQAERINWRAAHPNGEPFPTGADTVNATITERLDYLRAEIQAERISYSEIAELQALAPHIDPGDTELREWAGIPEGADTVNATLHGPSRVNHERTAITGETIAPYQPCWVIAWQSHIMPAPAFWYFTTETRAQEALRDHFGR